MSADRAVKVLGEKARIAILKEATQIKEMNIIETVDGNKLSFEDKKYVLPALTFIKEKCDGRVEARACADGHRRQRYILK